MLEKIGHLKWRNYVLVASRLKLTSVTVTGARKLLGLGSLDSCLEQSRMSFLPTKACALPSDDIKGKF